jgi:subtilase family serine protease
MIRSRSRALALMAASMVAVIVPAPAPASGTPGPSTRVARLAAPVPHGSTALGRLADDQPLAFDIVLTPSHRQELEALVAGQRDPASPLYQRYLAPGRFLQQFGPSDQQIGAVTSWLRRAGLNDITVDGIALKVRTNSGTAARALGVSMERYRTPDRRSTFIARGAPLVPSSIAGGISAILGLSDATAARPRLDSSPRPAPVRGHALPRADGLTPCASAKTAAGTGYWTPDQVGALYGVGGLLTNGQSGTGKKIALVELAPHSATNTSAYLTCFGLHNTVTTIGVDGGGTIDANGTLEANIDIEEAATQAPNAGLISYEGPNTEPGEFDVWQHIVTDDTAVAVSTSWGLCEDSASPVFTDALDILLAQAAAQGQTVVAASGDNGSEDCFAGGAGTTNLAVDTPADDPNITGVGGTYLLGGGGEPVWNDCQGEPSLAACNTALGGNEGAGGGGLSQLFVRPSWQTASGVGSCPLASCREVPDVSANAGIGEIFRSGGAWHAIGGTSIAAPKIAAIVADIDTACTARVGHLAPKLRALADGGGYGSALNDVITGDNDLTRNHGGSFPAAAGFDLASGVGTPIATGWSCPQIKSLSATTAAAGASLTVTGLALSQASITFGATPAAITAHTATTTTVVVPPGSGSVAVRGTNVMGSGTHTITFNYPGAVTTTTAHSTIPTTTTTTVPVKPPTPRVNTRAYRMVASDGGIFSFGGAPFYGSTGGIRLNKPIVGMATDDATGGYWFVASDGGIFGFHAAFFGSAGGAILDAPVVGMVGTPDGRGYRLVTAGGRVFAFGHAQNYGSVAHPHAPIVGIATTTDGKGYWLAGRDGSVYNFGDAHNYGSMFGTPLTKPIVGISADPATGGYWMVATDGGIFGFHAAFFGSTGAIRLNRPIVGIAPTHNGKGYWMVASDGGIFCFGNAQFSGSMGGAPLNRPIVGMAPAQ